MIKDTNRSILRWKLFLINTTYIRQPYIMVVLDFVFFQSNIRDLLLKAFIIYSITA